MAVTGFKQQSWGSFQIGNKMPLTSESYIGKDFRQQYLSLPIKYTCIHFQKKKVHVLQQQYLRPTFIVCGSISAKVPKRNKLI